MIEREPGAENRAAEVDRDDAVELLGSDVGPQRPAAHHACVVVHDVDAAELGHGRRVHRFDRPRFRHVATHEDRDAAVVDDETDRLLPARFVEVGNHH